MREHILHCPNCVARENIGLHALDIDNSQTAGKPFTKPRFDMCPDPAFIHVQRRRLDRTVASADNTLYPRLFQMPVAQFANGFSVRVPTPGSRRWQLPPP